jgi:hypothetical protein
MKIYRDCNGVPLIGPYDLTSNSPLSVILMHAVDTNEISPVCNPDPTEPHLYCDSIQPGFVDTGAAQEYIFQSNPVMISGVPPAAGWTFYWENCCRNTSIANLACTGYRLQTKMYPYPGRNTYPCFDSSPQFFEKLSLFIAPIFLMP